MLLGSTGAVLAWICTASQSCRLTTCWIAKSSWEWPRQGSDGKRSCVFVFLRRFTPGSTGLSGVIRHQRGGTAETRMVFQSDAQFVQGAGTVTAKHELNKIFDKVDDTLHAASFWVCRRFQKPWTLRPVLRIRLRTVKVERLIRKSSSPLGALKTLCKGSQSHLPSVSRQGFHSATVR